MLIFRLSWRIITVIVVVAAAFYLNSKNVTPTHVSVNEDIKSYGNIDIFSSIAPYYDRANKYLSFGMDSSWRKFMIAQLDLNLDDYILDLATGTGDIAILMATSETLYNPFRKFDKIVALDPSREMLKVALNKIEKYGLKKHIQLRVGDSQDLSMFPDGVFDKITMSFGIRNVLDRFKALKEMRRVIKGTPGSKLAIMEFCPPQSEYLPQYLAPVLYPVISLFLDFIVPSLGFLATLGHGKEYAYLARTISHFPAPKVFNKLLADSGFENCKINSISFGVVFLFLCEF